MRILIISCALSLLLTLTSIVTAEQTHHEATIGGDFTLVKHDGSLFNLEDIRGQVAIIFFGFTHCPDVCPNTLMEIQRLLVSLQEQQDELRVLFISVDPKRDTPDKLESYVNYFNKNMIGLTGDKAALDSVLSNYRAKVSYQGDTTGNNYQVEHNANLYLLDRQGRVASIILPRTPFEVLQQQVKKLIDSTH